MHVILSFLFPPGFNPYTGRDYAAFESTPNGSCYVGMLLCNVANENSGPAQLILGVEISYEWKYFFAPEA